MASAKQCAHRKTLGKFMINYAILFVSMLTLYAYVCTRTGWTGFDAVCFFLLAAFAGYVHHYTIHGWRIYLARHFPNDPYNLYHFWLVFWCYVQGKCPHKALGSNLKYRRIPKTTEK